MEDDKARADDKTPTAAAADAPRPPHHSQHQQPPTDTTPAQDIQHLQPTPQNDHATPDTSPALERLDELHAAKIITDEQHQAYTAAFSRLHHAVLRVYGTENALLARAKELNAELADTRATLDERAKSAEADASRIAKLREAQLKAEQEVIAHEELELELSHELNDLIDTRKELEGEVANVEGHVSTELGPQLAAMRAALVEAREERERQSAALARLQQERAELAERASELRVAKAEADTSKAQLSAHMVKVRTEPDKMKKLADQVAGVHAALEAERARHLDSARRIEAELGEQVRKRKELEDERMDMSMAMERHRAAIEQKERVRDDFLRQLELSRENLLDLQAKRAALELDVKAAVSTEKRGRELLNRRTKEYNLLLKKLKRLESSLEASVAQEPFLQRQLADVERETAMLRAEKGRNDEAADELRREVDVAIAGLLKEEELESHKAEQVVASREQAKALEEELAESVAEEAEQRKRVAALEKEREHHAREVSKSQRKARDAREEMKTRDMVLRDLTKLHGESVSHLRHFSELYELVRKDRAKYVHKIASSAQALAELKENRKILEHEVEILREESASKERGLTKERAEYAHAFQQRDQLRAEINRAQIEVKQQEARVSQRVSESSSLNTVINRMERELRKLKLRYESCIEERNYTGIELIDRNDELCILYEKSNLQQAKLKEGELQIRAREEELRTTRLQVAEFCREISVVRKQLPRVPELEREVVVLRAELEAEANRAEELTAELEAPGKTCRQRQLEGKDPTPEDLAAKLEILEHRLGEKKELLLEKELILEEVSSLTSRLRGQVHEGREESQAVARRVNELQSRIKGVTRRLMATVSELSMYQATALKISDENENAKAALEQQQKNLDSGAAPSDEVEDEWNRYEANLRRRQQLAQQMRNAAADSELPQITQTTAVPRPNAYIPDDVVGIPKPYGRAAPFKPTDLGANMRHIRKPAAKEVVL